MIKVHATPVDRFKAAYLPAESMIGKHLKNEDAVTKFTSAAFYTCGNIARQLLKQMGGTNTFCDRGVNDAQVIARWLEYINQDKNSELIENLVLCLRCFILQAFERRFRCQLTVEEDAFSITLPDSGRRVSHRDGVNFASIYRDQLMRCRDHLLRQLRASFTHHSAYSSEAVSEDFISTCEYFYLTAAWPDRVSAMDDYIISVNPSLLDSDQMKMLAHVVAGIISERSPSADWVLTDDVNYKPGSLPDKIVRAVREQVTNPNQTAVYDLLECLSANFNPPSEVIGFEDSIFVNPADDKGVMRDRYKMVKDFGRAPSLGVSTMWSKS